MRYLLLFILGIFTAEGSDIHSRELYRRIDIEYSANNIKMPRFMSIARLEGGVGIGGDICSGFSIYANFKNYFNKNALISYLESFAEYAVKGFIIKTLCAKSPVFCQIFHHNSLMSMIELIGEKKTCQDLINLHESEVEKASRQMMKDCIEREQAKKGGKGNQQQILEVCSSMGGISMAGRFPSSDEIRNKQESIANYLSKGVTDPFLKDTMKQFLGNLSINSSGIMSTEYNRRRALGEKILEEQEYAEGRKQKLENELKADPAENKNVSKKASLLKKQSSVVFLDKTRSLATGNPQDVEKDRKIDEAIEKSLPQLSNEQAENIANHLSFEENDFVNEKILQYEAKVQLYFKLRATKRIMQEALLDPMFMNEPLSKEIINVYIKNIDEEIEDYKMMYMMQNDYKNFLNNLTEAQINKARKNSEDLKNNIDSKQLIQDGKVD